MKELEKKQTHLNLLINAEKELTPNQLQKWKSIVDLIPEENRVYLSLGLNHLQGVMTVYNDWIQKGEVLEKKFRADGKIVVSDQGIELMPSFPDV